MNSTLPPSVAAAYAAVTTHRTTVAAAELDGEALATLLPHLSDDELQHAAYAARGVHVAAGESHDVTTFRVSFERGYANTCESLHRVLPGESLGTYLKG